MNTRSRMQASFRPRPGKRQQQGTVLAIALIFLVLVTLLATAASWAGLAQERLAAGQRQSSLALAGAETATRQAELWIYSFYERSNGEALVGMMGTAVLPANPQRSNTALAPFFQGPRWLPNVGTAIASADVPYASADHSTHLSDPPRYLIEDLGRLRPSGSPTVREGDSTGGVGNSVGGMDPAGNAEIRIFRITGKSKGVGNAPVRTVQSVFAGRAKT